jgi:hypothetical protein
MEDEKEYRGRGWGFGRDRDYGGVGGLRIGLSTTQIYLWSQRSCTPMAGRTLHCYTINA